MIGKRGNPAVTAGEYFIIRTPGTIDEQPYVCDDVDVARYRQFVCQDNFGGCSERAVKGRAVGSTVQGNKWPSWSSSSSGSVVDSQLASDREEAGREEWRRCRWASI